MKFGQLIEYNMRNIFLKEFYTKYGGETIPKLFLKSQNWAYLWINNWGLSKYTEIKLQTICFYLI